MLEAQKIPELNPMMNAALNCSQQWKTAFLAKNISDQLCEKSLKQFVVVDGNNEFPTHVQNFTVFIYLFMKTIFHN